MEDPVYVAGESLMVKSLQTHHLGISVEKTIVPMKSTRIKSDVNLLLPARFLAQNSFNNAIQVLNLHVKAAIKTL